VAYHRAGLNGAVAPCSPKLTPAHLQTLGRFADRAVVVATDYQAASSLVDSDLSSDDVALYIAEARHERPADLIRDVAPAADQGCRPVGRDPVDRHPGGLPRGRQPQRRPPPTRGVLRGDPSRDGPEHTVGVGRRCGVSHRAPCRTDPRLGVHSLIPTRTGPPPPPGGPSELPDPPAKRSG